MKKITELIRPAPILIIAGFLTTLAAFSPPSAAAMDTRLVLATEEVKREMRENGELPTPPTGSEEPAAGISPEDAVIFLEEEITTPGETVISPGEADSPASPSGPEPADLIVETTVVPSAEPAAPVSESTPQTLKEILERRVSLKYVDADIRVVLRSLARAYGFNITLAPEVQGQVTLDFTNVRIIDALETILIDQGLGYRITGEIIRVTTQEKIQQETAVDAAREAAAAEKAKAEAEKRTAEEAAEPLVVSIFKLKFIDANDAKEAIEPMLTADRGKAMVLQTKQYRGFEFEATETFGAIEQEKEAEAFVRSRILIIQDIQSVLVQVEEVIAKIDHRPPQILIDAKVLEVPISQESRLGINWTQALNGWKVGASDLQAIFSKEYVSGDERTSLTSHEWGSKQSQGQTTYDRVDRTNNRQDSSSSELLSERFSDQLSENLSEQALEDGIPSQLDEASRYNMRQSQGYQMNETLSSNVYSVLGAEGYSKTQSEEIFDNYLNQVASNLTSMATAGQAYSAVLQAADFNLMLSAMRTDSNVVVLSNPRIIVHENYAARIFVGMRYPIIEFNTSESGSGNTTGGLTVGEWKEIGITLKVIPQVRAMLSGGDSINMIVHPAVSNQVRSLPVRDPFTGYETEYPIIDIREADTNVTISDGDTIVIGGLISSRTMDSVSKIPLLGDIPILGYLFKEEHSTVEKINLLIFITARIVTDETEFSAYEKLMLEKMPPEALGDVRYTDDSRVRPYLYRGPVEPEPPAAEEEAPEPEEENNETDGEESAGNGGSFSGRVITRAMERSRR
ncbi:MAG: hypothetical protein P9M08_00445 [Candidatus Erginobacter occultus]|nr:hypothetical protein [Candidatus Erginobacter occultus]